MTAPIASKPVVRLRLTSQQNQRIEGRLHVQLGNLEITYPTELSFEPREQKWIDVQVTGGRANSANAYPLTLEFDAGKYGVAQHEETMRVNLISRRTIRVDGKLDDWDGALPQPIDVAGDGDPGFEAAMLYPFQRFDAEQSEGRAVGYVAHDDDNFYFAAKIADHTADDGTYRFATRDPNADFYPEISYEPVDERGRSANWAKNSNCASIVGPTVCDDSAIAVGQTSPAACHRLRGTTY